MQPPEPPVTLAQERVADQDDCNSAAQGGTRPAGDCQSPKHLPRDVAISMVSKVCWASASFSHQRTIWVLLGSQCGLAPSLSSGALKSASERRLQPPQEGACVLLKMVSEKPDSAKVCPKTERQPGNTSYL